MLPALDASFRLKKSDHEAFLLSYLGPSPQCSMVLNFGSGDDHCKVARDESCFNHLPIMYASPGAPGRSGYQREPLRAELNEDYILFTARIDAHKT